MTPVHVHRALVCCRCMGIPLRATSACQAKFPPVPESYIGKSGLRLLAKETTGEVQERVQALSRTSQKFAYYLEYEDDGRVVLMYDLLRGKKI